MSTYAKYRIWAGVTMDEIDIVGIDNHPFVIKVGESFGDIEESGLKFSAIGMHGETVGIGVIVQELNWTCVGDPVNIFDPAIATRAMETLEKVNQIFKDLGIAPIAKLYHHIDLGG